MAASTLPSVVSAIRIPTTFELPSARNYYGEGAEAVGAANRLAPGINTAQAQLDAGRASSALTAAQSVVPGYLSLAQNYAQGAATAARELDPASEQLRQGILRRGQEAAARDGLDPASRRRVEQESRSRFARTGRLRGNAAISSEAVALDRATTDRQAFDAQQATAALSAGSQYDAGRQAASSILSDTSFANRLSGLTADAYKVDPWNSYGSDLANTNYNAQVSQNMVRHNTQSALIANQLDNLNRAQGGWGSNGSGISISGGGLDPYQMQQRALRASQTSAQTSAGRRAANFY
jgi:hypothetical protein